MPIPIDERRKPASVKVHVTSGAGIDIVWSDTHASHYDFSYLREECPCAMCNDEREKKRSLGNHPIAPLGPSVLPMYKQRIAARTAHPVGNYALRIDFNDGHTTGIYSFDFLRTICPCDDCAREFRNTADSSSH